MIRVLPDIEPHPRYETIKALGVSRVARYIGCSGSHLYAVLQGRSPGSEGLNEKLDEVIHNIEIGRLRATPQGRYERKNKN